MLVYLSGKVKKLDLISVLLIVASLIVCVLFIRSHFDDQITNLKREAFLYRDALSGILKRAARPRYSFATQYEKVDYHDYKFIEEEAARVGPGEQGMAYTLSDPDDVKRNSEILKKFGFSGVVSDLISVNRSLPDVRLPECKTKKYLEKLPQASIVIVFYNEWPSMLKRTLHSIVNRTPKELLKEIILVNDNSTFPELYEPLKNYIAETFGKLVMVRENKERQGMTNSRLEGARFASGEILVFLDAHVEVNVNWLPPLLDPIAIDPKILTTPIIDNFKFNTFEYIKVDDGARRIFNWDLTYRKFPKRPEDQINPHEPFQTPTMIGSAFAINRQFFWDIGSYDHDLKVWQGEQLEMSFKAQLCAHGILEVPCSRIAHSFRNLVNYYKRYENETDYAIRNVKRIAEVWLDEFKDYVYSRNPQKYKEVDIGILTREKSMRDSLNCKPFRYFLEYVAPDFLERYPIIPHPFFAKGAIQSKIKTDICLAISNSRMKKLESANCDANRIEPMIGEFFNLTWHRNLQHANFDVCVTAALSIEVCHYMGDNQLWRYDIVTSQLINYKINATKCLTIDSITEKLSMEKCETDNPYQKWNFGEKNIEALHNWETFGVDLKSINKFYS